ncbi:MAG: arginine deiminase family protein [Candidatus Kapaibacterium sp.]|jgi:N-dimethylarginine dimethylaminohydrolase|nr:arginine deiminase family protein [Candidatus Kapabacteria bacterium]
MQKLHISTETNTLKKVLVGIANDRGKKVHENNPKISKHLMQGTLPTENTLVKQVNRFADLISEISDAEVLRPVNVKEQDQIFTRDIGFVINDNFVLANMKKTNRKPEQQGLINLLETIDKSKILTPPENANVEGGDVIVHGKYIFVGLTARTNFAGFEFLRNNFPNNEVIPFQMFVTDNPATNILHLDCSFQPVGSKYAILYENGFVHHPDVLFDIFGERNIIKVTQYEMYHMFPNIFSINPELVISDKSFVRLNEMLESKNIKVVTSDYQEVAKFGGLFRCSTMPLIRE